MLLNRLNQLELDSSDTILDEQFACPKCGAHEYSSMAMEKEGASSAVGFTITAKSTGPSSILYCKCDCGNVWVESYKVNHHRPLIRKVFMRNFQRG